jgi:hypothetical protein
VNAGVELLFDEFAARYARGEHPDAREYLERAGEGRDELARLLDGFLAAAPVQPPSEETLALFASLLAQEPPLLAERVRRGWRRDQIVEWICERFGIGDEQREKVGDYWHRLETGLLPVSGISARLHEALIERFGEALQAASVWKQPSIEARAAFRRASDTPMTSMVLHERMTSLTSRDVPEPDEVDKLFLDL